MLKGLLKKIIAALFDEQPHVKMDEIHIPRRVR